MKRRWIQFALALCLMALACVSAYASEAEEPTIGFRAVSELNDDVVLTPLDSEGGEVQIASDNVRYPGAVKMKVAFSKAQTGSEYLLCVLIGDESETVTPSIDNMAYIDQKTAESGTVEFTAFTKKPDNKDTSVKYSVYLSSNADSGDGLDGFTEVAKFEYYSSGLNYTLGDVNDDGEITIDDAYDALLISVNLMDPAPTEQQIAAANVDESTEEDNPVTVDDAYNILLCSVRFETGIKALDDYIANLE